MSFSNFKNTSSSTLEAQIATVVHVMWAGVTIFLAYKLLINAAMNARLYSYYMVIFIEYLQKNWLANHRDKSFFGQLCWNQQTLGQTKKCMKTRPYDHEAIQRDWYNSLQFVDMVLVLFMITEYEEDGTGDNPMIMVKDFMGSYRSISICGQFKYLKVN